MLDFITKINLQVCPWHRREYNEKGGSLDRPSQINCCFTKSAFYLSLTSSKSTSVTSSFPEPFEPGCPVFGS